MWAYAQHHGCPRNIGAPSVENDEERKFRNCILVPRRKVWLTPSRTA